MRVLVTNTRNRQAYTVVAAMRPHAERIVVTTYGANRLTRWLAPPVHSRMVDAHYPVPFLPHPWLSPTPSREEERYVQALLAICRRERIDIIIHSRDEVAYILSRHKARFQDAGVTVPVPDFPIQRRIMDKWEMLQVAERAGVPIPRTAVPKTRRQLADFVAEIGLPAVVKPVRDSGGQGMHYILKPEDLDRHWRPPTPGVPDLMVQEYIPGRRSPASPGTEIVIDQQGRCKALFQHNGIRGVLWNVGPPCAATRSACSEAVRDQTLRLLRALEWWGAACVEWVPDNRDGTARLLEPNARLGATMGAACENGVNLPLILAQVALGQDPEPVIKMVPGKTYVDPVLDVLATITYLSNRVGRLVLGPGSMPADNRIPGFREWLEWLVRSYSPRRRVWSDHWRRFPRDPAPALLFWAEQIVYCARRWRAFMPQR